MTIHVIASIEREEENPCGHKSQRYSEEQKENLPAFGFRAKLWSALGSARLWGHWRRGRNLREQFRSGGRGGRGL